eukprot:291663-Pelagomonas_calceolata.AAC.1
MEGSWEGRFGGREARRQGQLWAAEGLGGQLRIQDGGTQQGAGRVAWKAAADGGRVDSYLMLRAQKAELQGVRPAAGLGGGTCMVFASMLGQLDSDSWNTTGFEIFYNGLTQ